MLISTACRVSRDRAISFEDFYIFQLIRMRREEMPWEDIKSLPPHLRILAEDAKKKDILKKSGYYGDEDLPSGIQAFFAISILLILCFVIYVFITF